MTKAIRRSMLLLVLALGLTGCGVQEPQSSETEKSAPAMPGTSPDGGVLPPQRPPMAPQWLISVPRARKRRKGPPFPSRSAAPPSERERQTQSLGCGFIVASDGYVVINAHVVAEASEVVVRLSDRRELAA